MITSDAVVEGSEPGAAPKTPSPNGSVASPVTPDDARALGDALFTLVRTMKHQADQHNNADHGPFPVLALLHRLGSTRPSDLARETGLDLSTVSRHIRTLESDGHLMRTSDPDDRRAYLLVITDRGREFLNRFWAERVNMLCQLLSGWTGEEIRSLVSQLTRLSNDMSASPCTTEPRSASHE